MKTLFDLCEPREETLRGLDKEDVQELEDLIQERIDRFRFFEKTFLTDSLKQLFRYAFARFNGLHDGPGLVVLKQSMGGGKTHNMISLGLVAKYHDLRKQVLGADFPYPDPGRVDVVAFTGRNTDTLPWIAIAEQLNRVGILPDEVKQEREVPSDKVWKQLLAGGPVLILLDEIPYYLEYATLVPKGDGTKADFVAAGLANLFNALNSIELSKVMVVLSDLEAKYEKGGEYVTNAIALQLKDEAERVAQMLKPLDLSSPQIYDVLRTKLLKRYPLNPENDEDVKEIARYYGQFLQKLHSAGLISDTYDNIKNDFARSYPFHPGIIELAKSFRNNLRFQQTRGLLRLFRRFMRYIYDEKNRQRLGDKLYIAVSDYDLSDSDTRDLILSINPDLENAVSSDVYSLSQAAKAQEVDKRYNTNLAGKFAKAILFASLSSTDQEVVGLNEDEIFVYALEPSDDYSSAKQILEDYWRSTTYSKESPRGKRYFGYNENVNALYQRIRSQITVDEAEHELERVLKKYFTPSESKVYQNVYQTLVTLPKDLTSLELDDRKNTLVISKPVSDRGDLNETLVEWWHALERRKNRVMFLTGSKKDYDELLNKLMDFMAWDKVSEIIRGKMNANDPELKRADKEWQSARLAVLEHLRHTFSKLYYPSWNLGERTPVLTLLEIDYSTIVPDAGALFEFKGHAVADRLLGNNRDGEVVITSTLKNKKFIEFDLSNPQDLESFVSRFNSILLDNNPTLQRVLWSDIIKKGADSTRWIWHRPNLLDDFLGLKIRLGDWKKDGDWVIINPPRTCELVVMAERASVSMKDGTVRVPIKSKHGDRLVYQEAGSDAKQNAVDGEMFDVVIKPERSCKYVFRLEDSSGRYEPAEVEVKLPIKVGVISRRTDEQGLVHFVVASVPPAAIYYTTDGTSPLNSITRRLLEGNEIVVDPRSCKILQVVAETKDGTLSEISKTDVNSIVDPDLPVTYSPGSQRVISIQSWDMLDKFATALSNYKARVRQGQVVLGVGGLEIEASLYSQEGLDQKRLKTIVEGIAQVVGDPSVVPNIKVYCIRFELGVDFMKWLSEQGIALESVPQTEIEQP